MPVSNVHIVAIASCSVQRCTFLAKRSVEKLFLVQKVRSVGQVLSVEKVISVEKVQPVDKVLSVENVRSAG